MRNWNRFATAGVFLICLAAASMADEVGSGDHAISGRNLQAILVAMPEISRSGLDLAQYTINVQVVDGHTEVQLSPLHPQPTIPNLRGTDKSWLSTVELTPDGQHIARVIYCCR